MSIRPQTKQKKQEKNKLLSVKIIHIISFKFCRTICPAGVEILADEAKKAEMSGRPATFHITRVITRDTARTSVDRQRDVRTNLNLIVHHSEHVGGLVTK